MSTSNVHCAASTYVLGFTYLIVVFLLAGAQELAVWLCSISPWVQSWALSILGWQLGGLAEITDLSKYV